jgi:hypothetical protein
MVVENDTLMAITWYLLFASGPIFSLVGVYRRNILSAMFGVIMCGTALAVAVSPMFERVFTPPSIVPIVAYALVATVALMLVIIGKIFGK